ncbi:vicilin-like seed storage protein At2g18540 [Carica papaya]|uniref:vicilin-like seed storage protein At2g18540 n=1 Tax=Carica papaya TaxID=3649 RepID=UPI000B8D0C87|nr:vicilin-like seed storage protein At2g18540 [Carica papaya]XP_021888289.1 vicilin-like seed storage protein At2g18540 [Carica papaya]
MATAGCSTNSSLRELAKTIRSFSNKATSHHSHHQQTHKFLEASSFIGSWEAPKNPKEAESRLTQLRRDYAKQVKELRKEYVHEMALLRLEKQRKDEARMQTIRAANEERKRLKAEVAKVRAQERMVAEEEFRRTLLKERIEKLENWRMKEKVREDKKTEKSKLLSRQSSMWIDESELEKKIKDALDDTTSL